MTALITAADGSLRPAAIDRPTPGPTEVLIRNRAAGVNPVDWKRRDRAAEMAAAGESAVLGWDVAGEVVEAGIGVTRFKTGDRVFGMPRFPGWARAYAEYVVAGSREVARTPDGVDDITAGALPLAGLTAWQAVVDTVGARIGDRLLIHAGAGGVGHLAVQIAKAQGAEVWTTASARNHDALLGLGADHVIDYRSEPFEDVATDMDAVIDLVGTADNVMRSVQTLRTGGCLVVIPSPDVIPPQDVLDDAGITATWMLVEPDYASLERLAGMLVAGTLEVFVGDHRPLEQIDELHDIGRSGGPMGKLVAVID